MTAKELTKNEQLRLAHKPFCPLCGCSIGYTESFEYIKVRSGRNIHYNFFHTSCLIKTPTKGGDKNYGETTNKAFISTGTKGQY